VGIECDFVPGAEDRTAALLDAHGFDYVVGSVHFIGVRAVEHEGWGNWVGRGGPDDV
jgi:histidinol-phosphatase (PHP family)